MRRACLVSGLLVLALIWAGPLLGLWRLSFAAHMLAHMGVVAIAAPLLAAGLVGSRNGQVSGASSSAPLIASLVELLVVWGWHAPAARTWVEASTAATILEQASFLGAGLFLWLAAFRPANEAAGAFGLLLTSVHMTLLGALIALSSRPLYGLGDVTCFGTVLTPMQDQQIGAVVMLMVGAAVYLTGGVTLLARLLGEGLPKGAPR